MRRKGKQKLAFSSRRSPLPLLTPFHPLSILSFFFFTSLFRLSLSSYFHISSSFILSFSPIFPCISLSSFRFSSLYPISSFILSVYTLLFLLLFFFLLLLLLYSCYLRNHCYCNHHDTTTVRPSLRSASRILT